MEKEIRIEKPVFEREPDHVNSIGTRFWAINDFDELVESLPLDITVMFSEYTDDEGETFWGYLIIEDDTVMFETLKKDDVQEILETVKKESINRGLIEVEFKNE